MTGGNSDGEAPKGGESSEARRARLEAELRANLLKRKAQARARKAPPKGRDEGGQTQA